MEFAESVQKINSDFSEQIRFESAEKALEGELLCGGKVLLLSEGDPLFLKACCSQKTISLVFDGDCLPLFSMPDGIGKILASGEGPLLFAARYFAEVRNIPCVLFLKDASLAGAVEPFGEVVLKGERMNVPLKEAELICDKTRLSPSLGEAYGYLLISLLSSFEADALEAFDGTKRDSSFFELSDLSFQGIVSLCGKKRRESFRGEGEVLAALLKEQGEKLPLWQAFLQLSALYAAFFEFGKPRRYFTPDYKSRALRAGASAIYPPSPEEYAVRALNLERIRAPFAKRAKALLDRKKEFAENLFQLKGERAEMRVSSLLSLQILPERAKGGLSSIIRDFGLMEFER